MGVEAWLFAVLAVTGFSEVSTQIELHSILRKKKKTWQGGRGEEKGEARRKGDWERGRGVARGVLQNDVKIKIEVLLDVYLMDRKLLFVYLLDCLRAYCSIFIDCL